MNNAAILYLLYGCARGPVEGSADVYWLCQMSMGDRERCYENEKRERRLACQHVSGRESRTMYQSLHSGAFGRVVMDWRVFGKRHLT